LQRAQSYLHYNQHNETGRVGKPFGRGTARKSKIAAFGGRWKPAEKTGKLLSVVGLIEGEQADMSNFQLLLSIGIPSLLIVVGFIYNNSRLSTIEANVNARFNSVDGRFGSIETNFQEIRARLNTIEADLRHFYRELGKHEAEIANLKEQRRA